MGDGFKVGQRVRFRIDGAWYAGTVRKIAGDGPFQGLARVDDGDPNNDDLMTNGFVRSAWVGPSAIREVSDV